MTAPSDHSRQGIVGLDLIRLGAALMVVAYHLAYWWWRGATGGVDLQFRIAFADLAPVAASGWVGVPIFFVLSGFVIAYSAEGRTAGQFVRARAARLYPAAWVCATITFAARFSPDLGWDYVRALLLAPVGPWISGVYWTLAIEMVFYALVALTLWRGSSRLLVPLALGLGSWSLIFWSGKAADRVLGLGMAEAFEALENPVGFLLMAHDGAFFALGMLLNEARIRYRRSLIAPMLLFGAIGAIAVLWRGIAITSPESAMVALLVWVSAVGLVIASIACNPSVRTRLGPLSKAVRTLGLLTYPIYLVHSELGREIMRRAGFLGSWAALMTAVGAILLLSAVVLWLERPVRALVFGRTSRTREPASLP